MGGDFMNKLGGMLRSPMLDQQRAEEHKKKMAEKPKKKFKFQISDDNTPFIPPAPPMPNKPLVPIKKDVEKIEKVENKNVQNQQPKMIQQQPQQMMQPQMMQPPMMMQQPMFMQPPVQQSIQQENKFNPQTLIKELLVIGNNIQSIKYDLEELNKLI